MIAVVVQIHNPVICVCVRLTLKVWQVRRRIIAGSIPAAVIRNSNLMQYAYWLFPSWSGWYAAGRRVTCMAVPLICYKWKRSERTKWCNHFAEASESDNKEADH